MAEFSCGLRIVSRGGGFLLWAVRVGGEEMLWIVSKWATYGVYGGPFL